MPSDPILRICLEPALLDSAAAGAHNFINLITKTAEKALFRVEYGPISDAEFCNPSDKNIFALHHMKQPVAERGLVFRRVYYYPFWQIDQKAERWNWDVSKAVFEPNDVPSPEAQKFAMFWKRRLFGDGPVNTGREGLIYVPLQGRLTQHRSFQICSPLEMLKLTMQYCEQRKVVATLHPKEIYSAADMMALEKMRRRYPSLTVQQGGMEEYLKRCDFVVTQNSSAAFAGYFFGKPALLFGRIDFHHIAVRAELHDLMGSFAKVAKANPDYDSYLWWFWQAQSINAGRENAQARIAERFRRFGWPI